MIKYSKPYVKYKVMKAEDAVMKLLIIGSRSIKEYDFGEHIPAGVTMIISGGAGGIDTLAEKYADKKRLTKLIMRPRYDLYGRAAPLRRNEQMVELCDAVLAVWDGSSRGTKYTLDYAEKLGKRVILLLSDRKQG